MGVENRSQAFSGRYRRKKAKPRQLGNEKDVVTKPLHTTFCTLCNFSPESL